ncbi:MAG: HlyD family efflux transporter periplasmic adaptor subunit [Armatimonadota bacterium]
MRSASRNFKAAVIGIALVIALLIAMIALIKHNSPRVAIPAKNANSYATLEGTLEADEVDVSSKIPGRISVLNLDEGDPVRAGETLVVLESKETSAKVEQASGMYQAAQVQHSQARIAVDLQSKTVQDQVEQAKAGYKAAKAKLAMALNGARKQEIEAAQKAVEQATAAYETAKRTYDRFNGLYKDGVIPEQKEDEIAFQYKSAKAQMEAAQAKLSLVKEGARPEEIQQAREGVKAAQAALQLAQDSALQVSLRAQDVVAASYKASAAKGQLNEAQAYQDETRIVSPITGYVSQKMSETGEMVSAGFPVLTLVKSKDFKVKVFADESKFGKLQLGNDVQVIIPALNNKKIRGRVARISQAADFATKKATNEQNSYDVRSIEVVVRITEDCPELRTGMTARVRLPYMQKVGR